MRADRELVQHLEVFLTFVVAVAFVMGVYVLLRDYGPRFRPRPAAAAIMGLRAEWPEAGPAGWL